VTTGGAMAAARLLQCEDCDLLHRVQPIAEGSRALCGRCGALLFAHKRDSLHRTTALYLAALVLWGVANSLPFLTFELEGRKQPSLLVSGPISLYRDGLWELAALVFLLVIAFPLLRIVSSLGVLLPLLAGRRPRWIAPLFRWLEAIHPWAMVEVFLLGVLVAYSKLVDLATIVVGPALVAFVGLMVALVAARSALDTDEVWERIQPSPPAPPEGSLDPLLIGCHGCRRVCRLPAGATTGAARCPRCGAPLHRRKPNSLSRCWALVIAALILYVPANLYPVMTFVSFGRGAPSTILGGVSELVQAGMWPLAGVVFLASITVPVLKLISLSVLLVSVQRRSRRQTRQRTMLYRIVEGVGRWSMIDIFTLAILAALVQLGALATIQPGPGAIAFAAVVVLTMFAAMAFDPRLLWDAAGANHDR
jgi:paraquat-inducible protein A